ncbi:hypothetical protein C8R45DRAFT_245052 [Mycena sanguinolenta]|nr:hypothetical protein C8R45DRAFT_245052 [Mycena sanguinolenta]
MLMFNYVAAVAKLSSCQTMTSHDYIQGTQVQHNNHPPTVEPPKFPLQSSQDSFRLWLEAVSAALRTFLSTFKAPPRTSGEFSQRRPHVCLASRFTSTIRHDQDRSVLPRLSALRPAQNNVGTESTSTHVNPHFVNAFYGLLMGSEFGMFLIILTAASSPKVKRNATWYTFCFGWILFCISYTLTFIIGQQNSPSFGPCVTQAAAIYTAPILTSFTTLAFAIDMLLSVRAAMTTELQPKRKHSITLALLIAPFLIWLSMFVGFLIYGVNNPALVRKGPNGTYCDLDTATPSKISGAIVVFGTLLILICEGYVATRLFRNRNLLQDRRFAAMVVRVMIFSLLGAFALGIGFTYVLFYKQAPVFDISTALLPVGAVIIFGTHLDLFNVWLFWRDPRSDKSRGMNDSQAALITSGQTTKSSA